MALWQRSCLQIERSWVASLSEMCARQGFTNTRSQSIPCRQDILSPCTHLNLLTHEEISYKNMDNISPQSSGPQLSRLLQEAYNESKGGLGITSSPEVVIARKPFWHVCSRFEVNELLDQVLGLVGGRTAWWLGWGTSLRYAWPSIRSNLRRLQAKLRAENEYPCKGHLPCRSSRYVYINRTSPLSYSRLNLTAGSPLRS